MHWIRLIPTWQSAEIWMDDSKSKRFPIGRGIRQGCPLSPLLFNITIVMLVLAIHKQQEVRGIFSLPSFQADQKHISISSKYGLGIPQSVTGNPHKKG